MNEIKKMILLYIRTVIEHARNYAINVAESERIRSYCWNRKKFPLLSSIMRNYYYCHFIHSFEFMLCDKNCEFHLFLNEWIFCSAYCFGVYVYDSENCVINFRILLSEFVGFCFALYVDCGFRMFLTPSKIHS